MFNLVRRNAQFWLPILLSFVATLSFIQFAGAANNQPLILPGSILANQQKIDVKSLETAQSEIKNLHVVSEDLLRGAQPSYKGLTLLKKAGVKTIVNLRNEEKWIRSERVLAEKLGFKYVSIPLNSFKAIPQQAIDEFLRHALGPTSQPIFVHCMLGEDRTGLMCASYRMHRDRWPTQKAFDEAISLGFKPFLLPLVRAIWNYGQMLGYQDPMPSMAYFYDDIKQRINSKIGPVLSSR